MPRLLSAARQLCKVVRFALLWRFRGLSYHMQTKLLLSFEQWGDGCAAVRGIFGRANNDIDLGVGDRSIYPLHSCFHASCEMETEREKNMKLVVAREQNALKHNDIASRNVGLSFRPQASHCGAGVPVSWHVTSSCRSRTFRNGG
jgi:hypothetical protein